MLKKAALVISVTETDHGHFEVLGKAHERLRADINVKANAFNPLPEKLTMKEVRESIFEKKFVRTDFQRKILSV